MNKMYRCAQIEQTKISANANVDGFISFASLS